MSSFIIIFNLLIATFCAVGALADEVAMIKPYRSFITIQRYNLESTGSVGTGVSNARLAITFSNGSKAELPENGHYWPISNGQSQEVNRTFEIPWSMIQNDGTHFTVQIIRSGAKLSPCEFRVDQISQYNRAYVCHTDVAAQTDQKVPADRIVKESVAIRVFSDRNASPKDIPKDAIALRQ